MSNRSMLEFNHDCCPSAPEDKIKFAECIFRFLRGGDAENLPDGVTWFGTRHHSDKCPLGDPPRGWDNKG